jgi:hypothetical protein
MQNVTRTVPLNSPHRNVVANPSAAATATLVAAVAGKKYRVLSAVIVTTIANNVNFESNSTDISAVFPLGANGGLVLPFNEHGWFETAVGEALGITLSVATPTGVQVQYIELPA